MFIATVNTAGIPPQAPLRAPFGWPTIGLLPPSDSFAGGSVVLTWANADVAAATSRGGWLRISVSVDDRERKIVTASLARTGAMIGQFDLRYSHSLEPWQIQLNAGTFAAALAQGVRLTLTQATTPLWIFSPGLPDGAKPLEPHLLADLAPAAGTNADENGNKTAAFFRLLGSVASVQTFGWMEGCVLDALHALNLADSGEKNGKMDTRWSDAIDAHFALFITPDNRLVYENPRGQPSDGRIYGIEGTLPFAVLAKRHPGHPLLDMLLAYYRGHLNADGSFCAPESYTAEGSYTIAYPLAVIAAQRRDVALANLAANVLRQRRERLRRPDGLWLRHHPNDTRTFRSWARGVAWYLLGLVRTLEQLPPAGDGSQLVDTRDLRDEFRAAASWAFGYQRATGLWGCYLDGGEDTADDSSGSAGIAAALALGVRLGLFAGADEGSGVTATAARMAAERCWAGLLPHLTPDGFLDGTAQSNRGGESLQRAPYRVLSPMAMGLMGQLAAALGVAVRED
ncbi:glucuronyl hydrolase [Opitutaceae bacterium TAV4]|nr:glucuronyl hydrolase [Opitutaceae bacterium TAV3]RRK01409.1 glucuronyl hydrolase [Opitutaceae bacterium TAV4]